MTDNDAAKALKLVNQRIADEEHILSSKAAKPFQKRYAQERLDEWKSVRTALTKSAKVDGLLEALKIIEETTNEEIKKRFKCNSLTEKECAGSSRIYSLLVLPRNIARAAIQRFNGEG